MAFDDELDIMAQDCQDQLADCTITVQRVRPQGSPDPDTLLRTEDAGNDPETVDAIRQDDETIGMAGGANDKRRDMRAWLIIAADLTFRPGPETRVVDGGVTWRVVDVRSQTDGRDLLIVGERIK